ncbi:HD domain-containing phosphohydrolase [Rhizobium sp. MHM7A]|uniref:HD-GYP domain-containing protein n=1 Tax=Rhizobium sp. MHM7A TaxID=2583233 RepID=UPI0011060BF5|nr:HD domain-containing phosphohydrolase [Rhizobium sp. MHM7A]TLX17216.1 HD domain-containing protein [Rhizobium sp. MHM7A]
MHPTVQANIDELKRMLSPEDSYRQRLGKLSVLEAESYSDVAIHSNGVLKVAVQIAESMGMSEDRIKELAFGIRWHDIGKLAIPVEILRKPGGFEDEEWQIMKEHARAGIDLVGEDAPQSLQNIILYHHEKYAGRGYFGLKGEAIPLEARIAQVADVYDALCSKRDYKSDISEEKVLLMMTEDGPRGRYEHDPFILRRFVQLRLQDQNLRLDDNSRAYLSEYAASDPMIDFGKGKSENRNDMSHLWANDGWQVEKSGHRMLYRLDEVSGNKKLVEVRDPAGIVVRRIDPPALNNEIEFEVPAYGRA